MSQLSSASPELINLLNQAVSRELQVSIQYMWQHVQWRGTKGFAVKDEIKRIAIVEMKHAEELAERLDSMGAKPTTKPTPIFVGENFKEMLRQDLKDEESAVGLYTEIIHKANVEGDSVTRNLLEKILVDETEHRDTFLGLLEED